MKPLLINLLTLSCISTVWFAENKTFRNSVRNCETPANFLEFFEEVIQGHFTRAILTAATWFDIYTHGGEVFASQYKFESDRSLRFTHTPWSHFLPIFSWPMVKRPFQRNESTLALSRKELDFRPSPEVWKISFECPLCFLAYEDELEQIKSTYRLPRNSDGEPAHLPRRYEVELTMGGLHEEDKNEDGFFEFSADTKIEFTYNTDSDFLVLNAGGIRGYEIVSTDLECDGSPIEHQFEHYTEKEMLIINNKVLSTKINH